ncbi:MAG: o-succinylbenzoate synthase, partial [Synechococcus sp.]|nr:o-succinylbenzoate synthase [Synechococcus sp.]
MQLQWRAYRFALPRTLHTAQGPWQQRCGWLLRLQTPDGQLGWGEAAPLPGGESWCDAAINALPPTGDRAEL